MKTLRFWGFNLILALVATAAGAAAPSLTVGSLSGAAGKTVSLPIAFDPAAASIASMQFNLTLPKGVSLKTLDPGSIVKAADKSVKSNQKGRIVSVIIFGINQNVIARGDLLTAELKIDSRAPAGNLALPISNVIYTDPKGSTVKPGPVTSGSVTVAP